MDGDGNRDISSAGSGSQGASFFPLSCEPGPPTVRPQGGLSEWPPSQSCIAQPVQLCVAARLPGPLPSSASVLFHSFPRLLVSLLFLSLDLSSCPVQIKCLVILPALPILSHLTRLSSTSRSDSPMSGSPGLFLLCPPEYRR